MRGKHKHGRDRSGCIGSGWCRRRAFRCAMPGTAEGCLRPRLVLTKRPEPAPPSCPDVQAHRPVARDELSAMVAVEIGGGNRSQRFGAANNMCGLGRRQPDTHDRRLVRGEGDVIATAIAVKVCGQRAVMCAGACGDEERTQARKPEGTAHGRRHAGHADLKYTPGREVACLTGLMSFSMPRVLSRRFWAHRRTSLMSKRVSPLTVATTCPGKLPTVSRTS
jgi:hypothetical protein